MSLGRLLAVSHTLTSVRTSPSPYRLAGSLHLPKFGPACCPQAASPSPETAHPKPAAPACPETAASIPAPPPPPQPAAPAPIRTDAPDRSSARPAIPRGASAKFVSSAARAAWSPLRRLFSRRCRRSSGAASVLRQTELSLDTVRVVRNDLLESDVDVVVRPSAAAVRKSRVSPGPALSISAALVSFWSWARRSRKFNPFTHSSHAS
ncbi:MAG TPA: hypothetical protein P5555_11340 [Candidatus Paceibacterota bacterium]|nr:hypothetical protein [Verrucomicrobiota bacterium]HRZ45773.1 hypothetical protein [Candidatus Paceibacterota bacterium]HRZ92908.1 hypothetical protein [Candidatus Paceibacterota bacterium]